MPWGDTNTAGRSSPAPPCPSALWLERPQNFLSRLYSIQYPQCQEGKAAPGLAWLQISATWLLGGLGCG